LEKNGEKVGQKFSHCSTWRVKGEKTKEHETIGKGGKGLSGKEEPTFFKGSGKNVEGWSKSCLKRYTRKKASSI